jgi:CelD/BcsL family acetyltransferase involved in cellulose biosynthesis
LSTELVALSELTELELAAWRELAARAAEPNPFYEPEYLVPLARGTGQIDEVSLLVVRDGSDWSACLPVRPLRGWHRVPLRAATGYRAHPLYGLLGTPLVARERLSEAAGELVSALARFPGTSFATLEWIAQDGAVLAALCAAVSERGLRQLAFESFERAFLRRRPEPDYTAETVSPKHRRELRRQGRKLGEELGAEVEVTDLAAEAPDAAAARFVELESRSALAERGSVLASHEGHVRFFREMCRGFAEQGRLQLLGLRAGEQTLALKCNIIAGEGIFYFKIAFDETYRRFSPGMQLEMEMLKLFHERSNALWMDSCADANNAMINRLWPDRRRLTTMVVPSPGARSVAVVPALHAARAARDRTIGG